MNDLFPYKFNQIFPGYFISDPGDIHVSTRSFELCSPGTISIEEEIRKGRKIMIPSDIISRVFEYDKESALTLVFMDTCISNRMGEKIEADTFAELHEKVSVVAKKMADKMNENYKVYSKSRILEKNMPEPSDTPGPVMRVGR